MAITREWQILDADKVYKATAYLNDAVDYLESAIELIRTGKTKSSYEVFHTNKGNTIPANADDLIETLEKLIASINDLKTNVNRKAESLEKAERREYNAYLEEQKRKEQETSAPIRV